MQGDAAYMRARIDAVKSDWQSKQQELRDLRNLNASDRSSQLAPHDKELLDRGLSLEDLRFSRPGREKKCSWKDLKAPDFTHVLTVHMKTNQLKHLV